MFLAAIIGKLSESSFSPPFRERSSQNLAAAKMNYLLERQAQRYTVPEEDWAELEPVLGWMFDFRDYE